MVWMFIVGCLDGRMSKPDIGRDTGFEADVDVDVDTDGEEEGDLSLSVHLSALEGEVDCTTAGISEVHLAFLGDELTVPCDDSVISWYGVSSGSGQLEARGDADSGVFYEGSLGAELTADTMNTLEITLDCNENGILDGCGGA
jgi:hypothetical protein